MGWKRDAIGLTASHYQFNNSERAFLAVLEKTVGSHYYVVGKVKAFDVLQLEVNSGLYAKLMLKLFKNYHFDYVVCTTHTNEVVCAVELEKLISVRQANPAWLEMLEKLMQGFCSSSQLPRLIVSEQRGYDLNELIERFEAVTAAIELPIPDEDSYVL
ncbi:MAG: hypothetical protein OFPII_37420 [Osedax symbiont Rs1]|nr:MAG: hypothetical protein OFPII_37420 [Osedax symbiont Rs1]